MCLFSDTTFRGRAPALLVLCLTIAGSILVAGCGGKRPNDPDPLPVPEELRLSCPADTVLNATSPEGANVQFDVPAATGGQAPVSVECTPAPGGLVPIGESTVQCTATAANMVQAMCGFAVRVRVAQTLSRNRFLAFGDSITEGEVRPPASLFTIIDPLEAYPFKVEQMLRSRYPAQPDILVINEGKGGEIVHRSTSGGLMSGVDRLPRALDTHQPQVLLLQEGTNDLSMATMSSIAGGLRTMVSAARRRNIDVIIGNVVPVGPPHSDFDTRTTKPAAILELNQRIARIPGEFPGVEVVDLYALFDADKALLGNDGLHPTALGYTRIAEAFTDAIVRRYGQQAESLDSRRRPVTLVRRTAGR
jgi:lysophospholipase L1-like esterase